MEKLKSVMFFYIDGFKNMSDLGKKLWLIIIAKLIVIFVVIKLFLMPNFLETNFKTEQQKQEYMIQQLTTIPGSKQNLSKGEK